VGFLTLRPEFTRNSRTNESWVVDCRPPGCKWKLWLGKYNSERAAQRAMDVALFYVGNGDTRKLFFEDTPTILEQVCLPIKDFSLVSKDKVDQQFIQDLRSIVHVVIRKDFENTMGSSSGEYPIQVNYFKFAITN